MEKIYFYKMTTDSGGAPCVGEGKLSLAICKPSIRRTAREGDIVLGFGGRDLGEKLIYVARVATVVRDGHYYDGGSQYEGRLDCIYRWQGNELVFRRGARVHSQEDREHDVGPGGDHKRKANVLVADEFVYFGNAGTDAYKTRYPRIGQSIEALTQGHRINHPPGLYGDLLALCQDCIEKYGTQKILGRPHHSLQGCPPCHQTEGEEQCVLAYEICGAGELSGSEMEAYIAIVQQGDAVDPDQAAENIPAAKALAVVRRDGQIAGGGAVKPVRPGYARHTAEASQFHFDPSTPELGYVAVSPAHRGTGLSHEIVTALVSHHEGPLFATTSNAAMKRALQKAGFVQRGREWAGRRGDRLSLWLKER